MPPVFAIPSHHGDQTGQNDQDICKYTDSLPLSESYDGRCVQDSAGCPVFSTDLKDFPCPDVLLASEVGDVVSCHSAILAAASPLLRNILYNLQSEDDMIRIVFSEVEQPQLAQLVQYLYTGSVDLSQADREEVSAIIARLLIHRTFSPREDCQIKQECDYYYENQEEHVNGYYNYGDTSHTPNKSEENSEDFDYKPFRVVLATLETKKNKRKDETDQEWKPKYKTDYKTDEDSDDEFKKAPKKDRTKSCDFCDFSTNRFSNLNQHVRISHPEHVEEFQIKYSLKKGCGYCDEKFKTLLGLRKHVEKEHPENFSEFKEAAQFSCRVCDQKFPKSVLRRRHEKTVHNLTKLEKLRQGMICPVCGHQAPHKKAFSRHKSLWHKEMESPCKDCGSSFNSRWDLKVHMQEAHQRKHVRIIQNNQPRQVKLNEEEVGEFYCEYCGKGFTNQKQYKCHVKYHHQMDHQQKCKYCDFLGNKHSIERHEVLHFDPTLPCETCGKLFHHLTNLRRHQRMSHLPDSMKKHRCHICSKGFDEKIKLHEHFNVHTGAKPYKCRLCDMAYQNKSNRTAHERKAHGITSNKKNIGKIGTEIKPDSDK